jgi:hypothetical protein
MKNLEEDADRRDSQCPSPAWHARELLETEKRLAEGKEEVLDWEAAKIALRRRFD